MVLSSKQVSSDGTLDWAQNLLLQDGLVTTLLGLPKQEQSSSRSGNDQQNAQEEQQAEAPTMNVTRCPRCDSANTKFCYYNNYNRSQPRHFCKTCRRHWTKGGTLRNVPVGGGRKKNTNKYNKKRIVKTSNTGSSPALSTTASTRGGGGCTGESQVTSNFGIDLGPNFIKPILRVEQPGDHQHNYFVNDKHISVGSSYNNNSSSKISSGGLAVLNATTTSPSDHVDPQMPSFPLLTAHMNSYTSSNNENFDDSPLPSDLHHESDPALIEFAEDQFNNALYSLSSSTATPISMPPSSVHFNNHNFLDPGFWNWDHDLPTSSVSPDLKYFPYLDDPRLGV